MAADELLFRECLRGGSPFLRFYCWQPPGLSLGRFQREFSHIRFDYCRKAGIPVVRRLTGGRAVLHQHELTYSISSRFEGPFVRRGVYDVYNRISSGLLSGLSRLGVKAEMSGGNKGRELKSPNCFTAASRYEITWMGRKLVGSAQHRERNGFLQHGSILMEVEEDVWDGVFKDGGKTGRMAVGLNEILGRSIDLAELIDAIKSGLEETLQLDLLEGECAGEEVKAASKLVGKYIRPL